MNKNVKNWQNLCNRHFSHSKNMVKYIAYIFQVIFVSLVANSINLKKKKFCKSIQINKSYMPHD